MYCLKDLTSAQSLEKLEQYSKTSTFNLGFDIELCFQQILKLSCENLRGVNPSKFSENNIGTILKSKDQKKFILTKFNAPEVYQISTVVDNVVYKITYTLTKLKPSKTQIEMSEEFFTDKKLNTFRSGVGLMNFNKEFDKKAKALTLKLQKELVTNAKV